MAVLCTTKDFIIPAFSATNILLVQSLGDCRSNEFEKVKSEKALPREIELSPIVGRVNSLYNYTN